MHRRTLLGLPAALALGVAAADGPSYRVSLGQIEDALAQRFPLRWPVAGLFDIDVALPRLRPLPQLNRLGSELPVQLAGPALRRRYEGTLGLDFGLRYEAADRSVRAHALRVQSLQVPGLDGQAAALLQRAATDLAEQALLEVVLHRLQPRDLALTDAMGLEPGDITVTPTGLAIAFVAKRAS